MTEQEMGTGYMSEFPEVPPPGSTGWTLELLGLEPDQRELLDGQTAFPLQNDWDHSVLLTLSSLSLIRSL